MTRAWLGVGGAGVTARPCPMEVGTVRAALTAAAVLAAALLPDAAHAQSYRGWTTTSLQAVELRPVGLDTVPRADVLEDVSGRLFYNGHQVTCFSADACTGYLPHPDERTLAATQDLGLTFWGMGVEGLSMTTLLRARGHAGSDIAWPRSDDAFDAILAYAQMDRGGVRVRAGRQDVRSGLGFSGFDGLSTSYARGDLGGEVYAGRSLARGLREPTADVLRALDDFFVDESVLLFGGSASARRGGTLVTARYQREILRDRSSLVSERASLDASATLPRVRLRASADYDFVFGRVGKSSLTASAPLQEGRWLVELAGRRYVPYFDLSTIWGFFEPVSYTEVTARAAWSPSADLGAWVTVGRRSYGNTGTTVILEPMSDNGWRTDAGARWRAAPAWTVEGRHQLEWGPGGFLNSGDASVRYRANDRLSASLSVLSFQQIEEYRLGEGRAVGWGASADGVLTERVSVMGGFSLLQHRDGGNVFTSPWNQGRAWTSLRLDLGSDPGLANRRGRR